MQQSKFNYMADAGNGESILYNFFSGKCVRLNLFTADYYEHPEQYGEDHPRVRLLRKAGFLVDHDEIAYLRSLTRTSCGHGRKLNLVLCPTLQCNFSCPYCYETARSGAMSPEIQEAVVSFARRLIKIAHPEGLNVTWFGGEPLLEPEIIRDLSRAFMKLCDNAGIGYEADMVTNGYHLSARNARLLDECRIRKIQVTLDGPDAKTHDVTRHLRDGSGTFDRILENIRTLDAQCEISVRCNLRRENAHLYPGLKEKLEASPKQICVTPGSKEASEASTKQIHVYPGYMEGVGEYSGREIPYPDYALLRLQNAREPEHLKFHSSYCMTPQYAYFVVDEQGNLYKCWEQVGCSEKSVGNVLHCDPGDPLSMNASLLTEFMEMAWPGEDAECMSCSLLPACMGGCPVKRLEGRKRCLPEKYDPDTYVLKVAERRGLCRK